MNLDGTVYLTTSYDFYTSFSSLRMFRIDIIIVHLSPFPFHPYFPQLAIHVAICSFCCAPHILDVTLNEASIKRTNVYLQIERFDRKNILQILFFSS